MPHARNGGPIRLVGASIATIVALALFSMLLGPSLATATVPPAPVNTVAPTLTGAPVLGQTLTCSQGTWANNPTGYSYVWLRSGVPISGQAGSTYVVQSADQGHTISCQVTAGNGGGNYTIVGLPSGSYKVFFAAGFTGEAGNYLLQYFNGKNTFAEAAVLTVTAPNTTANVNAELHPGGEISGTATSATGKTPISGIQVCAYEASTHGHDTCGFTNSTGGYTIAGLPTGTYDVQFGVGEGNRDYLETEVGNVAVTVGGTTANVNAELQAGGEISGKVVNASGKAPIAGIYACAESDDTGFFGDCAVTDAAGEYTIAGLATDPSYHVGFYAGSKDGNFLDQYYNDKEESTEAESVPVTAGSTTPNINAEMHPGGEISGKVTSAATKAPVLGVEVCAESQSGANGFQGCESTNSAGEYTIASLSKGSSYKVTFSPGSEFADNYSVQFYNDTEKYNEATSVSVTPGSTTPNINAEMHPGGSIGGKVIDATTKAPVSGIEVCAEGEIAFKCAITDSAGAYTIIGLSTTSYAVTFGRGPDVNYLNQYYNGKSLYSESELVPVTAGSLTPNINAELRTGGEISGRVTNAITHAGIVGAEVCAEETGKGEGEGCATTSVGAASATASSGTVAIHGSNFTEAKLPVFNAKTGRLDFFFMVPTAGKFTWSLFFRNADVGFADSLGISLGGTSTVAEVANRKGKAKAKKCKKGDIEYKHKCVRVLVPFGSGSQSVPAGTVEVKVRAGSKALKALRTGHALHVSGTFTFQSSLGGLPVTHSVSVVVHPIKKPVKKAKKHKRR